MQWTKSHTCLEFTYYRFVLKVVHMTSCWILAFMPMGPMSSAVFCQTFIYQIWKFKLMLQL